MVTEQPAIEVQGKAHYLTRQETRQILTPFAFEIDQSLFGSPLARPWKRLSAILIDLMIIAMLSEAPGEFLAIVIAVVFFRYFGKRQGSASRVIGFLRGLARFFAALVIFVAALSWLPQMFNSDVLQTSVKNSSPAMVNIGDKDNAIIAGENLSMKQSLAVTALTVATVAKVSQSDCQTVSCWQAEFQDVLLALAELRLANRVAEDAIEAVAEATELPAEQQEQLINALVVDYQNAVENSAFPSANNAIMPQQNTQDKQDIESVTVKKPATTLQAGPEFVEAKPAKTEESKPIYSIIEYVKKLIEDLGLGFGWAAAYFTFFTAFWRGQTPGKKVFGIKVLQLDGTPLSLMDSFGRYGGYGAGIATGLLGFLQIFWDANRQAIHDKISATVVVDLRVVSSVPGSHPVNE